MEYDLIAAAFLLDEELEKQWMVIDEETEEVESEEGDGYGGSYCFD